MTYKSRYTALAWTDAKTAAVYFDQVLPVNLPDAMPRSDDDPIYYEVLQQILPEALLDSRAKTGLAQPVIEYVSYFLLAFPGEIGVTSLANGESLEQRASARLPDLRRAFEKFVDSSQVNDFAVYGEPLSPAAPGAASDPCLVLSNLNLVDTSKLTWRQVLELRRDQESVERLRNLRRAVYKDYSGKPEAYIREDIEVRIAEYESATRFWNLPTQRGVLEIAMTGEALTAVGAAIALTLFGAPVAAAAAAGGAIAMGKAALSMATRKRDIELERKRNPMAYLVTLRQEAERNA